MIKNNIQIIGENANEVFVKGLLALADATEAGPRGLKTKEILNAQLVIKNPLNPEITVISPADKRYLTGELVAYLNATNKLEDFAKFSKFWEKISDDGETVRSAYGYVIFKKYGFDQYQYVLRQLKEDKDSRKAVLHYKQAYEPKTKDNLCTISQQFFIRDNELHTTVNMRSNDIILGFRYDVFWFALLQKMLAKDLGIKIGTYTHNAASFHIYERHFKFLDEAINRLLGNFISNNELEDNDNEKVFKDEFLLNSTKEELVNKIYEISKVYE